MHTGYDYNYWLYSNQRLEPVKIDNHPAFIDNHKSMQGMGVNGNFYNYPSPQNNIPKSRKKFPNDQRINNCQNIWPSSVHSMPYRRPQIQNFQPPERFPVQPTNRYEPPQPVENCNVQQYQNSNVNFSQMQNVNYNNNTGIGINLSNQNSNIPRIRVKDISSLRNLFDYNSLSEYQLTGPTQKKQMLESYTSAPPVQNAVYNNEAQREQVNYNGTAVAEINQSYSHYGPTGSCNTHLTNDQQFQHSDSYYNQNAAYVSENQSQSNGIQQMEQQLTNTYNKRNYPLLSAQLNKSKTVQPSDTHPRVVSREVDQGNKVVTSQLRSSTETNVLGSQSKSPAFTLSDLLDSSKMNTVSQFESQNQLALSAVPQDSQSSPVTPPNLPVSQPAVNIPINSQNIDKVQITIPRNGDATVISLVNSSFTDNNRSSALCVYKENAVGNVSRSSLPQDSHKNATDTCKTSLASPRAGFTCKTPVISLNLENSQQQLEPVVGDGINEQNIVISVEADGSKQLAVKEAAVCPRETGELLIIPKTEKVDSEKRSFESEVTLIKIENEVSLEEGTTDKKRLSQKKQQSSTRDTDKIECSRSEVREIRSDLITSTDVITRIQESKKESTANVQLETRGDHKNKIKFQSKINRNKLNMLINFLNEDEKSNEAQDNNEKIETKVVIVENKTNPKPNRRKISKNSVVKNKNNEREMVSLVSTKNSKHWPTLTITSSDNSTEPGYDTENSNSSESTVIWEQSTEKKAKEVKQKGEPTKETTGEDSSGKKLVSSEETKIISLMRAFQNLKDHFCANCDFASPVASIWINVVSGELRCLNCFKKMMSKAEETNKKDRKHSDSASKSDSSQKTSKEKNGTSDGKHSKKKFNSTSHTSVENISNSKADEINKETQVTEEVVGTHTDEVLREERDAELSNKLKTSALEGNGHAEKEEQKKIEDGVENLVKSSSLTVNSSKHYDSKNISKKERHSTESKVGEKEPKSGARKITEEGAKAEPRHREEKSTKVNYIKEDETKSESRKRRNSMSPSQVPHKVRIVDEPVKKKEENQCQKEREDHSKKEKKHIDVSDKLSKTVTPVLKTSSESPDRKPAPKEESARRKGEEGDVLKSSKKEVKHEKTKIKDQITKVSHAKDTSLGKKEDKSKHKNSRSHSQSQHAKLAEELDILSKVFKEKLNTPSIEKHNEKETHKSHEHRKEHKDKKERHNSDEDSSRKIRRDSVDSEKKKVYAKIFEKRPKEKKPSEESSLFKGKSDKAVECSFEEILNQMEAFSRAKKNAKKKLDANSMLVRLMKKTKKLSQFLLDGAE